MLAEAVESGHFLTYQTVVSVNFAYVWNFINALVKSYSSGLYITK
jgi:hypothetical protein